jgi:hypothetical protein
MCMWHLFVGIGGQGGRLTGEFLTFDRIAS